MYKRNSYNSVSEKHPTKKWTENLNRHFSKEDIEMINRSMRSLLSQPLLLEGDTN